MLLGLDAKVVHQYVFMCPPKTFKYSKKTSNEVTKLSRS